MPDIFSYDNPVRMEGALATADFAFVYLDGQRLSLLQNFTMDYRHQVQEIAEIGNPNIFWIPGRPSGAVQIGKLVGDGGIFSNFKVACGRVGQISIDVTGKNCGYQGQGSASFSAGIIESISFSVNTGQLTMAESASLRVTNLNVGG